MSTLKIEERILVSAPPARVWAFLLDPARVAACLPGAKLDGVEGERTFLGTMKVKVGPVTMEFKGKATMSEVHEEERRVVLTGTGSDKSGSGSAKMAMESRIVATEDGGAEILVVADVDLAGKLVSFGRGMMVGISKQIFKQFAERVRAELTVAPAEEAAPAPVAEEPPAPEIEAPAPAPKAEEAPAPKEEAPAPKVEEAPAPKEEAPAPKVEEAPAPKAEAPAPKAALARGEDAPLDAGSLVFTVIWEWIKSLFGRLFRRTS